MSKMTVSQGLRAIHDLKGKLANHRAHAQASSVYFDGAKPAFEFKTELDGAEKVRADLLRLQTAIAVANATTEIEWKGKKVLVAWAIRFLEELKGEIAWVGSLPTAAQGTIKEDNFVNRIVNGTYQVAADRIRADRGRVHPHQAAGGVHLPARRLPRQETDPRC